MSGYDVIIIGSGAGGATLARALGNADRKVKLTRKQARAQDKALKRFQEQARWLLCYKRIRALEEALYGQALPCAGGICARYHTHSSFSVTHETSEWLSLFRLPAPAGELNVPVPRHATRGGSYD